MSVQLAMPIGDPRIAPWIEAPSGKFNAAGAQLADGHYSRRTPGSPQFMPPGDTIVLVLPFGDAVWGWWRPDPDADIEPMNGLDGWTCSIFRNTSAWLSSDLILRAETALAISGKGCGPGGMLTYVWDKKVRSVNPGYCFKCAGWTVHRTKPRSADGKKTLLWKAFELAGVAP